MFFFSSLTLAVVRRWLTIWLIISFVSTSIIVVPSAHAGESFLRLPQPGAMVNLSPSYEPVLMKGLQVHPENPFLFDFILDVGGGSKPSLREESARLIKYFLASLTIPEKDLWVNLSPYERNRMIAPNLGQTTMGRDMLAQDYILKQLTASLIYPEKHLGKTFWDEVYAKARLLYGTTNIPVNTFNKVWIVADKADVFERGQVAYIVGAHLKVMLEEDYVSLFKHQLPTRGHVPREAGYVSLSTLRATASVRHEGPRELGFSAKASQGKNHSTNTIASEIIRHIILPQIEKEINQGKNFAPLRQMFYSMVLSSWYKMALKNAILTQIYGNKSKVKVGVNQADPKVNDMIFERYLRAYKKGVFNYIKDSDLSDRDSQPRKYFSGGLRIIPEDPAQLIHEFHNLNAAQVAALPQEQFIVRTAVSPEKTYKSSAMTVEEAKMRLKKLEQGFRIGQPKASNSYEWSFYNGDRLTIRGDGLSRPGELTIEFKSENIVGQLTIYRPPGNFSRHDIIVNSIMGLGRNDKAWRDTEIQNLWPVWDNSRGWQSTYQGHIKKLEQSESREYFNGLLERVGKGKELTPIKPEEIPEGVTVLTKDSILSKEEVLEQFRLAAQNSIRIYRIKVDGKYRAFMVRINHAMMVLLRPHGDAALVALQHNLKAGGPLELQTALDILEREYDLSGHIQNPVPRKLFDAPTLTQAKSTLEKYLTFINTAFAPANKNLMNQLVLWLLEHPGLVFILENEGLRNIVRKIPEYFEDDYAKFFWKSAPAPNDEEYLQILRMGRTIMRAQNSIFKNDFLVLKLYDHKDLIMKTLRRQLIKGLNGNQEAQLICASAIAEDGTGFFDGFTKRKAERILEAVNMLRIKKANDQIREIMGEEFIAEVNAAVKNAMHAKELSIDEDLFDDAILKQGINYYAILDQYHFQSADSLSLGDKHIQIHVGKRAYRVKPNDFKIIIADTLAKDKELGNELIDEINARSQVKPREELLVQTLPVLPVAVPIHHERPILPPLPQVKEPKLVPLEPAADVPVGTKVEKIRQKIGFVGQIARRFVNYAKQLIVGVPRIELSEAEKAQEMTDFIDKNVDSLNSTAKRTEAIRLMDELRTDAEESIQLLNENKPLHRDVFAAQGTVYYSVFDRRLLEFLAKRFDLNYKFDEVTYRHHFSFKSNLNLFIHEDRRMEIYKGVRLFLFELRSRIESMHESNSAAMTAKKERIILVILSIFAWASFSIDQNQELKQAIIENLREFDMEGYKSLDSRIKISHKETGWNVDYVYLELVRPLKVEDVVNSFSGIKNFTIEIQGISGTEGWDDGKIVDVTHFQGRILDSDKVNIRLKVPVDRATLVKQSKSLGGIDFTRSHMNIHQEEQGVQMRFDPAMLARIKRDGFDGLDFYIQSIMRVTDLPLLLGLK